MEYDALIEELRCGAEPNSKEMRAASALEALQKKIEEWTVANSTLIQARNQAVLELGQCVQEKAALKELIGK